MSFADERSTQSASGSHQASVSSEKIISGVDFAGKPKRDDPYGLRREHSRRQAKLTSKKTA